MSTSQRIGYRKSGKACTPLVSFCLSFLFVSASFSAEHTADSAREYSLSGYLEYRILKNGVEQILAEKTFDVEVKQPYWRIVTRERVPTNAMVVSIESQFDGKLLRVDSNYDTNALKKALNLPGKTNMVTDARINLTEDVYPMFGRAFHLPVWLATASQEFFRTYNGDRYYDLLEMRPIRSNVSNTVMRAQFQSGTPWLSEIDFTRFTNPSEREIAPFLHGKYRVITWETTDAGDSYPKDALLELFAPSPPSQPRSDTRPYVSVRMRFMGYSRNAVTPNDLEFVSKGMAIVADHRGVGRTNPVEYLTTNRFVSHGSKEFEEVQKHQAAMGKRLMPTNVTPKNSKTSIAKLVLVAVLITAPFLYVLLRPRQ